jgi:hypothetical protein
MHWWLLYRAISSQHRKLWFYIPSRNQPTGWWGAIIHKWNVTLIFEENPEYAYSGPVINLPQAVGSFVNSLPRLPSQVDVMIIRKEGAANSHHDFRVRKTVVLRALQWLLPWYYYQTWQLPEDGNLTGLCSVTINSISHDLAPPSAQDEDPYNSHLSEPFIPSTTQRRTEQETIRHFVQDHQQQMAPPTLLWPPSGRPLINEFNT